MSLTVKTDDVTKGRKDMDPHGRFRGKWVNLIAFIFLRLVCHFVFVVVVLSVL